MMVLMGNQASMPIENIVPDNLASLSEEEASQELGDVGPRGSHLTPSCVLLCPLLTPKACLAMKYRVDSTLTC